MVQNFESASLTPAQNQALLSNGCRDWIFPGSFLNNSNPYNGCSLPASFGQVFIGTSQLTAGVTQNAGPQTPRLALGNTVRVQFDYISAGSGTRRWIRVLAINPQQDASILLDSIELSPATFCTPQHYDQTFTLSDYNLNPGIYRLNIRAHGIGGNARMMFDNIDINAAPAVAGPLTGPAQLCVGQQSAYTSTGTSGGTWSSSNAAIVTVDEVTGVATPVSVGSAYLYYSLGSIGTGCNIPLRDSIQVSVSNGGSAGTITGQQNLCIGQTYNFTSSGSTGGTWSSNNPSVASVDAISGIVTANATGNAEILYTVAGCGSNPSVSSLAVTVSPNVQAGTVSGPAFLCAGSQGNFTSNGDPGGSWISSNPAVASIDPVSGQVNALSAGTTEISYQLNGTCGTPVSSASLLVLSLNPVTGPVSGPTNACPYIGTGAEVTYSLNPVPGATSYQWIVPSTLTLVSGQGTNNIQVTINNGFIQNANKVIRVRVITACGTSPYTLHYLLAQAPSAPSPIQSSSSDVCSVLGTNTPIVYTIPKVTAATSYIWEAQAGTTSITHPNGLGENDTTITVTFGSNFTSSLIRVRAVNNCGTSNDRTLQVVRANPSTPGLISGPTNACAHIAPLGSAATYSVAPVSGAGTYTWQLPAGIIGLTGQGTNSVSFTYPAGYTGGSISVTASNGCGSSGARILNISTLSAATPGVITENVISGCPNRVISYSIPELPANATSVLWTASGSILSGQGTNSITVSYNTGVVSGQVTATAVNNCGNSVSRSLSVNLPACPPNIVFTKTGEKTGILSNERTDQLIQLYPNPTTESFNMIWSGENTSLPVQIRVMDQLGKTRLKLTCMPGSARSFGKELSPGTYWLEVIQGEKRILKSLIKY